jgi:hypothetical protein
MTSHELAAKAQEIVNFLLSKQNFKVDGGIYISSSRQSTISLYSKAIFTDAAKAIGNARKEVGEGDYADFSLISTEAPLALTIARNIICRKVIKYECEPLFTADEISDL